MAPVSLSIYRDILQFCRHLAASAAQKLIFVAMEIACVVLGSEDGAAALAAWAGQIPGLRLTGTFSKVSNALEAEVSADFLLLHRDGLPLSQDDFEALTEQFARIVMVSGEPAAAVEAYDQGIVDFLLEPISEERFQKALRRVRALMMSKASARVQVGLPATLEAPRKGYFFVKSDYKVVKIMVNEIQYIEGLREYVRIHTTKGAS
jgi:CheY-like chemotaxis protein